MKAKNGGTVIKLKLNFKFEISKLKYPYICSP